MKKNILIVDDDKSNLVMAQQLLTGEYHVAAANSGALALRYLEKNEPDLILLDIQMPEMDGFEVMKKIRESEKWRRIPVIFLTAERGADTEESCFQMGAVDFITKPFIPTIMQMRVRRSLELEGYRKSLEGMVRQQLEQITRMQQDIIMMMANLIENRDGTTGGHIRRTSIFAAMLAEKMLAENVHGDELDDDYVELIKKAAPLHDIGKITVSDLILQKPGALTEDEYELMKRHAEEGGKLIRENMNTMADLKFVKIASEMANYHHEKWSGGGYPANLKGEEIPLSARILAVADVFDALAFKRQYKEAMSLDEAFEIMEQQRGGSFEPAILDTFLELKGELREVLRTI